jgi:hypothetical protein
MLSREHETLVEIFRRHPELVVDFLRALGVEPPAHEAIQAEPADQTEVVPVPFRADLVVGFLVSGPSGKPVLRIVFEVQRCKKARTRFTWPVYAASERARHKCPALVLVYATTRAVARWAAKPIDMGGGNFFRAIVIGPDVVPVVTDRRVAAAKPEVGVLSAVAHGRGPSARAIARAAIPALDKVPDELAVLYLDAILTAIGSLAEEMVKEMAQTHVFQSEYLRGRIQKGRDEGLAQGRDEGLAQGRDEGLAQGRIGGMIVALLAILDARGLPVSVAQRERMTTASDAVAIDAWIRRAASAVRTEDIFESR